MLLTLLFLVALIAFASLLTRRVGSYGKTRVQVDVKGRSRQVRVKCRTTSVSGYLTLTRLLRIVATYVLRAEQTLKNFRPRSALAACWQKFKTVAFRLGGFSTVSDVLLIARRDVDQRRRRVLRFWLSPKRDPHALAQWMCFVGVLKR